MPAILFVVLGGGVLAYLLSKQGTPAPTGTPLPPVLPGQAPGTSFGPSFGPPMVSAPVAQVPLANFGAFSRHFGLVNLSSPGGSGGGGMPPGHAAAPIVMVPPTPAPVQVPSVQHVMVATHDTGPTGNLAIRSAPGKGASVLTEAPHGSVLAVTGSNVDDPSLAGGWSPVLQESTGIAGYAATMYLKAI
jgi:hypothetical protein